MIAWEKKAPAAGSRVYSDLFDSVTQREVLENSNEHDLVKLYSSVLSARAQTGHEQILTDSQVLDGAFFLRWLARLRARPLPKGLFFKFRAPNLEATILGFVRRGDIAKEFEFSALADKSARDALRDCLARAAADATSGPSVAFRSASSLSKSWAWAAAQLPKHSRAFKELHDLQTKATKAIGRLRTGAIVPWDGLFNMDISFEDPGGFVAQLDTSRGRELAIKVFRGRSGERSPHYRLLDRLEKSGSAWEQSDARAIRSWYARAYNRTIAYQHGASIFETTHLHDSLWWARANGRDHATQKNRRDNRRRIVKGLRQGVKSTERLDVPEAGVPALRIPSQVAQLRRADGKVLSQIEYLQPSSTFLDLGWDGVEPAMGQRGSR